jgi:outer membrane lipoprotein carrier protein
MRFFLSLMMICALAVTARAQTDVYKLADRVDDHYNHIQSLQVHFTETYNGAGIQRRESGTLKLKKPGKMRWDYQEPQKKLFVSDGKTAWFYVPGEQQARRAAVKKLDDLRSPLQYLLGKTKLEKEFESLSLAPDAKPVQAGDAVLRGVPKSMADRVSQVLLEITPDNLIRRITIEELDGSSTTFDFSDEKINVPLADAQFKFNPPPGVETVEATGIAE